MEQPFDMSNLGAMLQQLGAMMQRAESLPDGAVDWDLVRQTARSVIAQEPDPSVVAAEQQRVRDSVELAQLWLDAVTDLPAPSLASAAWSRSEWLEGTFAGWMPLLEAVAGSMEHGVADVMRSQELPPELSAAMAPMMRIMQRMAGMMAAQQVGQALGALARDAWSASDVGVPLTTDGRTALVTSNSRAFADGLGLELRDLEMYLVLREAAAQRLFHASPWIAPWMREAVTRYSSSVRVDHEQLREMLQDIDATDPTSLQAVMGQGLELPMTPGDQAAAARIELLITLIEGWIDHMVELAHGGRIGNAHAIQEALRRRRAAGGPAERTFTQLLGMELRPRRLRTASAFWAAQPAEERDAIWRHPDFLPDQLED